VWDPIGHEASQKLIQQYQVISAEEGLRRQELAQSPPTQFLPEAAAAMQCAPEPSLPAEAVSHGPGEATQGTGEVIQEHNHPTKPQPVQDTVQENNNAERSPKGSKKCSPTNSAQATPKQAGSRRNSSKPASPKKVSSRKSSVAGGQASVPDNLS